MVILNVIRYCNRTTSAFIVNYVIDFILLSVRLVQLILIGNKAFDGRL